MSIELPRLLGPYVLLEQLHGSAHGATFLARERDGRTPLVIKRLRDEVLHRPDLRARLLHEAQLAVAIDDPRVVRALGVSVVDEVPYVVMELVEGWSLADVLATCHELRAPWSAGAVVALLSEALRGLEALHGAVDPSTGVHLEAVHRDLSPHNVMVRPSGQPVLIDLGLGRSALRRWETQTGALLGTPGYMAPEQVQRRVVDHRADLYAVGVLAFELLTLERYIAGGDVARALRLTCEGAFRPPSSLNPAVPSALDAAVERALALAPADRYPTAAALRDALCAAAAPDPAAARRAVPETLHQVLAVRRAGRAVLMLKPTPAGPEHEPRTIVLAQASRRAPTLVVEALDEPRGRPALARRAALATPAAEDPDDATHLVEDPAPRVIGDPDDITDPIERERAAAAAWANEVDPDDATLRVDDARAASALRFQDATVPRTEPVPIRLPTSALRPLVPTAAPLGDTGPLPVAAAEDTGPVDTRAARSGALDAKPGERRGARATTRAADGAGTEDTGPVDASGARGAATEPRVASADARDGRDGRGAGEVRDARGGGEVRDARGGGEVRDARGIGEARGAGEARGVGEARGAGELRELREVRGAGEVRDGRSAVETRDGRSAGDLRGALDARARPTATRTTASARAADAVAVKAAAEPAAARVTADPALPRTARADVASLLDHTLVPIDPATQPAPTRDVNTTLVPASSPVAAPASPTRRAPVAALVAITLAAIAVVAAWALLDDPEAPSSAPVVTIAPAIHGAHADAPAPALDRTPSPSTVEP